MVRNLTLLVAALFVGTCPAQVHNALDFDGIDDQVTASNGSAGIANAAAITLGCWVYPRNAAPEYPDFDGFAGFRNEFDADFYLLQISPANTVEARFRNSLGDAYSVTLEDLELDSWQYLTLVYDGSMLRLYLNGVEAASTAASGTITSATEAFHIGNVPYTQADFLLDGKVDDVALWSRALSAQEVMCAMHDVSTSDTELQLYYKCDQGTASGNNAGENDLDDLSGHTNALFNGFALTGSTSNFVAGVPYGGGTTMATTCPGVPYVFHGQSVTQAGVTQIVVDGTGSCDSLATLLLAVTAVNVNVVQAGNLLTATAALGPYQWLDCGNGYAPVPGATNQSFTPTASGQYALRRTSGACADTSTCYTVTITGIEEARGAIATVAPSPTTDRLTVTFKQTLGQATLRVLDLQGREVLRTNANALRTVQLDVSALPAGPYLLQLQGEAQGTTRFLKQ
ncbi:MAG TPA: LamG-like jellyroll fold domain-containing protein [Flavobacteriales bacterium]|jgi:hypothetical protein|nr:LamG-like jellyroll fold domain-containing protein [Flavobacteriales bacterium]